MIRPTPSRERSAGSLRGDLARALDLLRGSLNGATRSFAAGLEAALGGTPPGGTPHEAAVPSRLTPSGFPAELALVWPGLDPRFTVDPSPAATSRERLVHALERGAIPGGALAEVRDRAVRWQLRDARWGAWLGVRPADGGTRTKLYLEVPAGAPWQAWEEDVVGARPVLPNRGIRLVMLGLDPAGDILELYYEIDHLYVAEVGTLMRRPGLPDRGAEICDALAELDGRSLRHRVPARDLGFSYALDKGGARAFTFYTRARSLLGGDGGIREATLAFLLRRGWETDPYETLSRPLAGRRSPGTWHGLIGFVAAAAEPLRFTLGLAPPGDGR